MHICLQDITQGYNENTLFKNFSLSIWRGECVCLIGPSGLGKTTLLKMVAGLIKPRCGKVDVYSDKICYVFQEHRLLMWRSIYENIRLVNEYTTDDAVLEVLDQLGIGESLHAMPKSLSGGMLQRAAIARALISDADIILLDEPFKSLDALLKFDVIDYLTECWTAKKQTAVVVTHDIDVALTIADRIICLNHRPMKSEAIFKLTTNKQYRNIQDAEHLAIKNQITEKYLQK